MTKYTDANRQLHLKAIRQVLAMKPRASTYVIADSLYRIGLKLDRNYIAKLRDKIVEDRVTRFNEAKVEKRISEMQEKAELIQEYMFPILTDPKTPVKEKIRAAREIMKSEVDLFNSQMDAGMFERKLGELGIKHDVQLDPEDRKSIVDAFINMGLIKEKKVTDINIIDTTTQAIENK